MSRMPDYRRVQRVAISVTLTILAWTCGDGSTSPKTPADLITLQVGETRQMTGADAATLHVAGGTAGAEYALVLSYPPRTGGGATIQVAGENVTEAQGPPTPRLIGGASPLARLTPAPHPTPFGIRLRELERTHLATQIAALRSNSAWPALRVATLPVAGDELSLNVSLVDCGAPTLHQGRVQLVSDHAVFVEDEANPSGGLSAADYQTLADAFESVIYPVLTENFGSPTDVDNNGGRIIMFFTRAVNEMTSDPSSLISGFFYARDLVPKAGAAPCPGSNEAEILYLLAPDPNGAINNVPHQSDEVVNLARDLMPHSGESLISAGQRLLVNHAPLEEGWLDQGLGDIADELAFYKASGMQPRHNISLSDLLGSDAAHTAVNIYQIANFYRLQLYLAATETTDPTSPDFISLGASWQVLRYAADHSSTAEPQFWKAFINSPLTGLRNLASATETDVNTLFANWAVAQYADDAGFPVNPAFQNPSWNFRSILPGTHNDLGFSLTPHSLQPGAPLQLSMRAGGTAYARFGVAATQYATIQVSGPSNISSLVVTLLRTK